MPAEVRVPSFTEVEAKVQPLADEEHRGNSVVLYEHRNFDGEGRVCTLNLSDYAPGVVHSLHAVDFKDCLSSLTWSLEPGVIVRFYEHHEGSGRQYVIHGGGQDPDTHDNGFKDCASSWSWYRS